VRVNRKVTRALFAALFVSHLAVAAPDQAQLKQGEYMFHAAGCATCHTDEKHHGAPLAGGRRLATPFGVFYSPNITPDRDHGIGRWSDADFLRALRDGVSPRGENYYPVFPYAAYTHLRDDDILAIKAYLFSRPPVGQTNKPHELPWYLRWRAVVRVWKIRYFTPGPFAPRGDRSPAWNRGAYLATAAAHCSECHTPRDRFGGVESELAYAGTREGPDNGVVPNITPDKKTGIGTWTRSDLVEYLETGQRPDGDFAGDLMADVIDNSLKFLTKDDLSAIATYLVSLPPIAHAVRKEKKKTGGDEFGF
jgi:mono/diheme cytochrome c family protein